MSYIISRTLDTCGLNCPEPVMMLHKTVREMAVGDIVEVIATDPSTRRDIPRFCDFLEHQLLANDERDDRFYYHIRKGEAA